MLHRRNACGAGLRGFLHAAAAERIRAALAEVGGVRVAAASRLAIDQTPFDRLMRKCGIEG